jgi:hypothetical protein
MSVRVVSQDCTDVKAFVSGLTSLLVLGDAAPDNIVRGFEDRLPVFDVRHSASEGIVP